MAENIDTPSADYLEALPLWSMCRDVLAGSHRIKKTGDRYLPRPSGMTPVEFAAYMKRASFYNASARTHSGLSGLIFRKKPVLISPPAMADAVEAITPQGHTVLDLAKLVIGEVLATNYFGLLVDHPAAVDGVITAAQARSINLRPYISTYKAESIIGVDFALVNNRRQPVRVRLVESADIIRELRLNPDTGIYEVVMHVRTNGGAFLAQEPRVPLANGKPLDMIPFLLCSDEPVVATPPKPMLLDLIETNISHFQTSADLEHGAHHTALPTTVITGVKEVSAEVRIGASTAILLEDPNAKVFYHALDGEGLAILERRAAAKEQQMAALGARMLQADKTTIETAETHRILRAGEYSVLASMANTVSRQITLALSWVRDWSGVTGDIGLSLSTDYFPGQMSANDLVALTQALQAGAMSYQSYFEALKDGEIVRPELTFEDEQERRAESLADRPVTPTTGA